jgi:hypothetical protein
MQSTLFIEVSAGIITFIGITSFIAYQVIQFNKTHKG